MSNRLRPGTPGRVFEPVFETRSLRKLFPMMVMIFLSEGKRYIQMGSRARSPSTGLGWRVCRRYNEARGHQVIQIGIPQLFQVENEIL